MNINRKKRCRQANTNRKKRCRQANINRKKRCRQANINRKKRCRQANINRKKRCRQANINRKKRCRDDNAFFRLMFAWHISRNRYSSVTPTPRSHVGCCFQVCLSGASCSKHRMFKVFTVRLKIVYNFGFSGCNMAKESLSLLAHKKLFPEKYGCDFSYNSLEIEHLAN